MKKNHIVEHFLLFFHRFARYTKQQKVFVLYLFVLSFFLLVLPVIRIAPVNDATHMVWLLNGHLIKVFFIVLACITILFAWNLSFQFKNFVIGYFGFKENDALINFGFLWIIATSFLSVGDTINVVSMTTQAITVSSSYYFLQLLLLLGLILTLLSILKHAKENGNKTKIVNVVDEEAIKEVHNRQSLHGLFENE